MFSVGTDSFNPVPRYVHLCGIWKWSFCFRSSDDSDELNVVRDSSIVFRNTSACLSPWRLRTIPIRRASLPWGIKLTEKYTDKTISTDFGQWRTSPTGDCTRSLYSICYLDSRFHSLLATATRIPSNTKSVHDNNAPLQYTTYCKVCRVLISGRESNSNLFLNPTHVLIVTIK